MRKQFAEAKESSRKLSAEDEFLRFDTKSGGLQRDYNNLEWGTTEYKQASVNVFAECFSPTMYLVVSHLSDALGVFHLEILAINKRRYLWFLGI